MKRIIAGALLLVILVGMMCGCSAEKKIVGTWKYQDKVLGIVTETTYKFNEDGTGTKTTVLDVDFKYSFFEDKLRITTTVLGLEKTEEYTYEIKKDKLTLKNDKETISLERVE